MSSIRDLTKAVLKHRELAFAMARRDISQRYAGQAIGYIWALIHPLFLMTVFVFVFGVVFRQRIGGTHDLPLDYTVYILSGITCWLSFQEGLISSCMAISGNASLVKQVVFPIQVLPVSKVLGALFSLLVTLSVILIYSLAKYGELHLTILLLPFVLSFQAIMMCGLAFILSSVGAFVRDLKDFITMFAVGGMYILPVVYLPEWIPELFRPIIYINPFSYFVWCYQDVLYFGRFEHPIAWLVAPILALTTLVVGYRLFKKLKPSFGNVL
jgi:lipopolysaccharide transport system permease protein